MISIVDDDQSVREATRSLLRSHGYAAVTFASAEEFLRSGLAGDTSCLISDVRMAGLSGLELQRLLIDSGHRVPIIFMTAFPEERARALVSGSRLDQVSERRRLWSAGLSALQSSPDPMIQLALAIDAEGRALRARRESELDAVLVKNSELIAKARFAVYGTGIYPDATGSPRLSFGTVRGWREPMRAYFDTIGAEIRDVVDLDLEDGFVELLRASRPTRNGS